ncbi:hypothetical protein SAMN02982929_07202 [Saccharopolyspora kobensis]|uniref:Uncharacterized protein n=1 Tax=Saccharopolyspora kobensis TaxID=146035 RepID=A0A1H6ELJ0_9PSEU|nr:hypothetical protein [Saccharopolyspora kobensis]SEG98722.1 hypothetical protein SAMN02982929_07202 [Saccharopolyspora kobensis]SFD23411.1 hypothetical protein SAMN05216506_103166 [Saccharopolyspora kobensis]
MTPAEELRQAAAKMRKLGAGAISGPWRRGDDKTQLVFDSLGASVAGVHWGDDTAEWIATMSPAIAEPLAELLEGVAARWSWTNRADTDAEESALALARQINSA